MGASGKMKKMKKNISACFNRPVGNLPMTSIINPVDPAFLPAERRGGGIDSDTDTDPDPDLDETLKP